jgi:hypothetical protein
VPGVCLFFEAFDAVGVGVGGAGFLGGRFLASACLFGCFLVCAAQGDFLCDFRELVFQRMAGEVGPFAGAVWGAAAEGEAQPV